MSIPQKICRIVRDYVEAALEGRYATADYLSSELPAVDTKAICPGADRRQRQTFACSGTINTDHQVTKAQP